MLIKEYRVTLPLTVEEYRIAQLYSVAEASKNETGGGEGIQVVKNEPFSNYPLLNGQYSSGQYTYKIYHIASKIPSFITYFAPKGSLEIHEEAWNAYPYCKTIITNPGYMKKDFSIVIESFHVADRGKQENVHQLPPEKLEKREVVRIDISNDPVKSSDYKKDLDPSFFTSTKTNRGPLVGNWIETADPVMTCYKLVSAEFKWRLLQNKVENIIQSSERRIFTTFHREVFCWMDNWYGLTMDDIRMIEEKTREELDRQRSTGNVRGMVADAE